MEGGECGCRPQSSERSGAILEDGRAGPSAQSLHIRNRRASAHSSGGTSPPEGMKGVCMR